jgi:two-component system response regulator FixJ
MFTFDAGERVSPWLAIMDDDRDVALAEAGCLDERQHGHSDVEPPIPPQMVYIVEDGAPAGQDVRGAVRSILPVETSVIRTYRTTDAFLAKAKYHQPGVVIVNGCLSESGGMALLSGLRSGEFAFAVVVLTVRTDVALAVRAMKHGAVDVIEMPCKPHALSASIQTAFQQVEQRFALRTARMAARARIDQLSRRERMVLSGVVRGSSNKRMASDLDLSPRTVEIHRANLMHKLGARHLADVMRLVYTAGMIDQL